MSLLLNSACLSVVADTEYRPLNPRMSAPGLTSESQMQYLLQWFGEFSELQREDFLPVLAAARGEHPDQLAASLASISCEDKPVSLFQCRIKLFNDWFPTWAEEEQDRLIKGVSEIDPVFGTKLLDLMTNGPNVNGEQNGDNELQLPNEEVLVVNETAEADVDVPEENGEQTVTENIPVEIAAAS